MFNKKLKQKIISLEAKVRGLDEENRELIVKCNQLRLERDSEKKANKELQDSLNNLKKKLYRPRNKRGQFVKHKQIGGN